MILTDPNQYFNWSLITHWKIRGYRKNICAYIIWGLKDSVHYVLGYLASAIADMGYDYSVCYGWWEM